jgi:Zn-finger nucleic acid-binding protein
MEAVEETLDEMVKTIEGDKRHLNEIKNLTTKLQRVAGARAVLRGVEFQKCPRCAQVLPDRNVVSCSLCGQAEPTPGELSDETSQTRSDLGDRERELEEMIEVQSRKYRALRRRGNLLLEERNEVDRRLNDALKESDSAYLSAMLENERMLAEVHQELRYLDKIAVLPRQVAALKNKSDALAGDEAQIRTELLDARQKAESDLGNLDRLGELFLDCLVRASIPGFSASDRVEIGSPDFVPEVIGRAGELATSTFDNLGSGGKKTLFKCCFALAVHRLAAEIGGILPTLLILDSPMKNISERENRSQFEGFHQLLYELGSGELNGTQFILIDKELCPPPATFTRNFLSRHMTAGEETAPPLISYYRGIQEASEEEAQAGETEIEQHLEEEVGDEE